MPTWEEAQKELIDNNTLSGMSKVSDTLSWEDTASELANSGRIPPPSATWKDANSSLPSFMEKSPIAEGGIFRGHGATGEWDDPSLFEKGWDTFKRISSFGGKAIWEGLGIIAWPLERIEYTLATPITAIQEEKPIRKLFVKGEGGAKEASDKVINRTIEALKTWVPGRPVPEEAKTWNDMWGNYYETLIGEPAPDYYKWTMGGITGFVVDPAVQAKMLKVAGKPIAKPLAKLKETISPQVWKRLKLERRAQTGERVERAKEIGQTMAKKDLQVIAKELSERTGKPVSTKAVQERLAQIIKGGVTEQPELAKIANPVISEFQNNLKAFRELNVKGMLGKQVFTERLTRKQLANLMQRKAVINNKLAKLAKRKFPGRQKQIDKLTEQIQDINNSIHISDIFGGTEYFPRMYATKEVAQKTSPLLRAAKRLGIKGKYLTKRRNLPFEVRKELGEITTAQYPVVKRLIQQAADIETAKLFRSVAENPNLASRIALGNRKLIPDNPEKYGALANMFVHPKVHSDVMEMGRIKGNVEQVYDEAISMWKLFKVAWSPGAHFRNKFGNSVLKTLSGMSEQDKVKYGYKAWKELKNNTEEYKIAKKYLKSTTFMDEEVMKSVFKDYSKPVKGILGRTYSKIRKIAETPGKGYQALEFHDKFTLYLKARDEGKSVIKAVEHANKWLFDYGDLAVWEKNIARRIMPFYTFPRKALPRVMEAAVNNPHALYKYPLMAKMATQYSLYKLDIKDDDYKKLQKILPEYMKQGSYILMPYRDKNGDLRFFDWTYMIPWGEMVEASDRGLLQSAVNNPLFALVSDIQHNKSTFTGREIWKETDTTEEKTWKSAEYIWKALVPSMSFKGIYWDKMYRAATGKTMYGKKELVPETIAHTIFGIRLQSLDENLALRRKMYDVQNKLRELQGKMMTLIRKQGDKEITPQEANELRTQYMKQIQDLIDKDIKGK